jgi:hypothetical protein
MAGGYKLWSTGEVVTATNLQNYIQNQTVMVFASAAARTTALSGVVAEGMLSYRTDSHILEYYTGSAWSAVATTPTALTNVSLIAPIETANVVASAATGTINIDCVTSSYWYYTTNASANWTLNFRGNSGTTLNSLMAVGQSMSIVFLNTNGATAYYPNAFTIDGTSITPKWSGGTAPSAGNASAIDAYTFTILKTAATPTYTIIAGGAVKFA